MVWYWVFSPIDRLEKCGLSASVLAQEPVSSAVIQLKSGVCDENFSVKTSDAEFILTSRLAANEASTPVVTLSDSPCLSIWSVSFLTVDIFSSVVAGWSSLGSGFVSPSIRGGVSSPLTEDAEDAFFEAALDESFDVAVFFLSFPSSARFA